MISGCGGGGSSAPANESSSLETLGYTLMGRVIIPDGSSPANVLVRASLVENAVTQKQAYVMGSQPTGQREFKATAKSVQTRADDNLATVTDAEGFYLFTGLEEGTYFIEATKGSFKAQSNVSISPREATVVDLTLTPSGSLTGICLLENETDDHSGTFVIIKGSSYIGYTDDDGSFSIQQIPVGSYQVRLVHQGYETYEYTGSIAIPAGDAYILETVNLLSFQGGMVEGQVTAQDKQPVPETLVEINGTNLFAMTGDNGHYLIRDVKPGSNTVTFKHDLIDGDIVTGTVEVLSEQTTTVNRLLNDSRAPVWESTPGVIYVFNTEPETGVAVAVEFGRVFDASLPATFRIYYNQVGEWDRENWENNDLLEVAEADLYTGVKAENGCLVTDLDPTSWYVFGVRVKDRHGNQEYNTAEYVYVPEGSGAAEGGQPFVIDSVTGLKGEKGDVGTNRWRFEPDTRIPI